MMRLKMNCCLFSTMETSWFLRLEGTSEEGAGDGCPSPLFRRLCQSTTTRHYTFFYIIKFRLHSSPKPPSTLHISFNIIVTKTCITPQMQMQTQQRTPLSNRETRNKTNVSSAYSWNSKNRLSYHVNLWEFHVAGAEKPKLQFPILFVRTCGICSCPNVEDQREAHVGSTETGFM